jgi:hypothetical protein
MQYRMPRDAMGAYFGYMLKIMFTTNAHATP